jgi:3-hydroxyacyl-[acyl-carrier-protein] dehydratase
MGKKLDAAEIANILPQAVPFRFLDGATLVEKERVVAYFDVDDDHPILAGHFPGLPVMPGMLLVEAILQATIVLAVERGDCDPQSELIWLMTVERARFRAPVKPPCRLELEVVPLRTGKIWKAKGVARVGQQLVAEATFTAAIRPR